MMRGTADQQFRQQMRIALFLPGGRSACLMQQAPSDDGQRQQRPQPLRAQPVKFGQRVHWLTPLRVGLAAMSLTRTCGHQDKRRAARRMEITNARLSGQMNKD